MTEKMYPTKDEVQKASLTELTTWNRFLPSPETDEEIEIIEMVCNRYAEKKADDNYEAARVSKKVGWG